VNADRSKRAEEHAEAIVALSAELDRLSKAFRADIEDHPARNFDKYSADEWRRNTYGNALVRLRQIAENNFNFIETLGLLAVARYVFELSVWLRLFQKDAQYCLVYYRRLLETLLRYHQDSVAHLHREIDLLNRFQALDKETPVARFDGGDQEAAARRYAEMIRIATDRVDAEASKHFAIYFDDAKTNGYGVQANMLEKKVIPQLAKAVSDIEQEIRDFDANTALDVQAMARKRWQWRAMAEEAALSHEHDYIYSYASKLLHATPASIHTNQKNLEISEMCIFLRYIRVKFLEIIDLAYAQPESQMRAVR
jgi:hypothetical protein